MRTQKLSLNPSAFPQERGFFTEADIRAIMKSAVQEVISSLMIDEDPGEQSEEQKGKREKLTVTVQEAADLLNVSKPKMFEILHTGGITYRKVGKKILISYQSLIDWVNDN